MTDVGSETTEMKTRGTIAVLDLDSHVSDPGDTGVIKLTAIQGVTGPQGFSDGSQSSNPWINFSIRVRLQPVTGLGAAFLVSDLFAPASRRKISDWSSASLFC